MNIQVLAAAMLAAFAMTGCGTFKSIQKARPPSGPLSVSATWSEVTKERMQDYYGGKDSFTTMRTKYDTKREEALSLPDNVPITSIAHCKSVKRKGKAKSPCVPKTIKAVGNPAIKQYQDIGLMLSEVHCNAYLAALDTAAGHQTFMRETANDTGTAANAMLALLKNATAVVSVANAGFSLVESVFKNYQQAYLPGEDIKKAKGIFQKARLMLLTEYANHDPESLAIAEYRVNFYSSTCNQEWSKRLLEASAEKASPADIKEIVNAMGADVKQAL